MRPGGTLSSLGVYSGKLVAPYEAFYAGLGDQTIVTTLCPGGKERMRRLMSMIANRRVDLAPLVTHHFALDDIETAFDLFSHQRDGVLKVALYADAARLHVYADGSGRRRCEPAVLSNGIHRAGSPTGAQAAAGILDVGAPPAVAFERVTFAFDDHVILRDISFAIPSGGMTILLGASGAGKSVLLEPAARLFRPDSGDHSRQWPPDQRHE